jgi:hypothetical protein
MLQILGSMNPFREGVNRREVLRAGGLTAMGLSISQMLQLQSLQAGQTSPGGDFGKASGFSWSTCKGPPRNMKPGIPNPTHLGPFAEK